MVSRTQREVGGSPRVRLSEAEALYAEQRGRAMSASTIRLRWWAHRLPAHTSDTRTLVRRRAVLDEMTFRGVDQ